MAAEKTLRTCEKDMSTIKVAIVQLAQPVRKRERQRRFSFLFQRQQEGR